MKSSVKYGATHCKEEMADSSGVLHTRNRADSGITGWDTQMSLFRFPSLQCCSRYKFLWRKVRMQVIFLLLVIALSTLHAWEGRSPFKENRAIFPRSKILVVLLKTTDFHWRDELLKTSGKVSWRRAIIELRFEGWGGINWERIGCTCYQRVVCEAQRRHSMCSDEKLIKCKM